MICIGIMDEYLKLIIHHSGNDSEDMQSGCDSDDSCGVSRKKYPTLKL